MKTRKIYFNLDDRNWDFDFGTYVLIMFYAKNLDADKAKMLYDSTLSESDYNVNYNLLSENLLDSDGDAHFVVAEIQQTITFINNELIPALNSEPEDLLVKYGGRHSFYELFYNDTAYFEVTCIDLEEFYDSDPKQIAHLLNLFKNLLQYSLDTNLPLDISVR
jgi:hypothetical protein